MKAMTLRAPGGLDNLVLVERSRPVTRQGQVVIEVHANSLNYHDYVVAKGQMPVADGRVLMSDGAGRVVEVGEGVESLQMGDDVFSLFYPRWQSGEADALVGPEVVERDAATLRTCGLGVKLVQHTGGHALDRTTLARVLNGES